MKDLKLSPKEYIEKALKHKTDTFELVQPDLIHGIIGICSEAGEIADLLKKLHFHPHKNVTREKIVDECGDLLWYIALTLRATGYTFEEAMARNVAKLDLRYLQNAGEKDRAAEAAAQAKAGGKGN